MAFQSRKQHYFSRQIITTNRQQYVINQVATTSFINNPVQMGNPGISSQSSGPANMLSDGQRKHSGSVSTESESKRLKMQSPKKQDQAVKHLVNNVETLILNILKENDAEILSLGNLNMTFKKDVNNFFFDSQKWREYATIWEIKTMSIHNQLEIVRAGVRRLQGLLFPNIGAEEQDVKSYCGINISEKNSPSNVVEDVGETPWEVQTGEGSGEKRMCMSCGEMEMSVLALPCWHLCFCIVCGTHESILQDPCRVCKTTITATAPVSLV